MGRSGSGRDISLDEEGPPRTVSLAEWLRSVGLQPGAGRCEVPVLPPGQRVGVVLDRVRNRSGIVVDGENPLAVTSPSAVITMDRWGREPTATTARRTAADPSDGYHHECAFRQVPGSCYRNHPASSPIRPGPLSTQMPAELACTEKVMRPPETLISPPVVASR